jgi:two-component system, sensor histidine kinase PdtaS
MVVITLKHILMKNRFCFSLFFLLVFVSTYSQSITRQDADSMLTALKKVKKDIDRIDLLLNMAQYQIFKPGELPIDFDSALVYIKEAKALNKSVKSGAAEGYILLTDSYLTKERGQRDAGKKMAEQAVATLEGSNNKHYLGRAYYELSSYYGYEDSLELNKRIGLINQAVAAFKEAGTLARNAYSLVMLGDLYSIKDDLPKAIEVLHEALAAYESIKYPNLQGVYILLGQSYQYQQNEPQALFYMLKALKTAQAVQDTSMQLCQINNVIGILYFLIDMKEMSAKYFHDALEVAKKYHDDYSIFLLVNNLSDAYNQLNQPEKALQVLSFIPDQFQHNDIKLDKVSINISYLRTYMTLKQFSKAQPYCDTILHLANTNHKFGDQTRVFIYRMAALYYINIKQFEKAKYYLTKNVAIYKRVNFIKWVIEDARLWYKVDSAQGNFQSAFDHLVFYKSKMDSLFARNRVKQLQALGVEYETAMKEDSIKVKNRDILNLTQKNTLQQNNLQQARLIKNITVVGIVLAFVVIILLYRQYNLKQKSNNVITLKNTQLQHYLDEKEWLLKEIHHRVKNNLQIVMSLLNSQSAFIDNEPALTAIHDSQHRVHAMSLIHQKLYSSDNLSAINMDVYIRELVSYLADSFNTGQRIRFEFSIEPLELDVSQAVPLGLILNEAITNSIKYAFPDDRNGVISISLSKTGGDQFLLSIADNGIGMSTGYDLKKPGSLGMSLMAGLSEDLEGSFVIENNNGTMIKVYFVHDPRVKRPGSLARSFALNN